MSPLWFNVSIHGIAPIAAPIPLPNPTGASEAFKTFGLVMARAKANFVFALECEVFMAQSLTSSPSQGNQHREIVLLPAQGTISARKEQVGKIHPAEENPRPHWEACGFSLLDPSAEQEQMGGVPALLPAGWTLHPAEDRRTAALFDDQGRGRAFFAVPSQTSPKSCMIPWARFMILTHCAPTVDTAEPREEELPFKEWCYKVVDTFFPNWFRHGTVGRVLYSSHTFAVHDARGHADAVQSCELWLNERWPDWKNPFAYWQAEEKP